MKVTTNSPDLLIIEDRPIFIAIALILFTLAFSGAGLFMIAEGEWWGLFFMLFGGGMGVLSFGIFVRRVQVVFHRPEGYVEVRRRNVFGAHKVRHDLTEIARAELQTNRGSDGPDTYRVVLVIDEGQSAGRHPVTRSFSNGSGHQTCMEAINDWLTGRTA